MRRRGFTIIELLIVVAIIGLLVGIGGVSIKKQAESRAMLRVRNEIGDFFRVAAKRSQETGKRYGVHFDLVGKKIEISRNGNITDTLKLPNIFEYEIKSENSYTPPFTAVITSGGDISEKFNFYVIQGTEEVKYVINFDSDDHINYLHVREHLSGNSITVTPGAISVTSGAISGFKLIRE